MPRIILSIQAGNIWASNTRFKGRLFRNQLLDQPPWFFSGRPAIHYMKTGIPHELPKYELSGFHHSDTGMHIHYPLHCKSLGSAVSNPLVCKSHDVLIQQKFSVETVDCLQLTLSFCQRAASFIHVKMGVAFHLEQHCNLNVTLATKLLESHHIWFCPRWRSPLRDQLFWVNLVLWHTVPFPRYRLRNVILNNGKFLRGFWFISTRSIDVTLLSCKSVHFSSKMH